VALGKPWDNGAAHALVFFGFYQQIRNEKITSIYRPNNADSYILLSAGHDGEYGTGDDIFNF
jgi:hypothetical protein